ncbi:MAG: hypothetical protein AAB372_04340 [Patescibacteria group bacterium]
MRRVLSIYRRRWAGNEIPQWRMVGDEKPASPKLKYAHGHWMLDQIEGFLEDGRMEKAFRWLGFVQGMLWSEGVYTLDELMEHNRPRK